LENQLDAIKKALGNAPVFVVAYILFMLPTYYLPYAGSNSSIIGAAGLAAGMGLGPAFWMHFIALLVLCLLCWIRGAHVAKKWLIVFPILALIFDITPGLTLIPMVPTVMHLLAIILGVVGAKASD